MKFRTLAVLCGATVAVYAADPVLRPSVPSLDRPTLTSVSIRLPITGDDNYNATVAVRYRKSTATAWTTGIPLYRIRPDTVVSTFIVSPQFAGSIFDLSPATTYEIELTASDPDGSVNQTFALSATTRPVPADPPNPRIVNVSSASTLNAALSNAQPGDVITLANGVYAGTFIIFRSGTAGNPIVIRGASRDNAIVDAGGCTPCNALEIYGSYVHVERLTIRNAERAIRFQTVNATSNAVRRIRISNTRMGIGMKSGQTDFYIADNILEGRLRWPTTFASNGAANANDEGIAMMGSGHVVAHNQIAGYSDSILNHELGWRDSDIYGNDILDAYDNAIELDNASGNVRCLRNRMTNAYMPLSTQVVLAGPAYIVRNVGSNIVLAQIKVHGRATVPEEQPNGIFAYHNTFVSASIPFRMDGGAWAHHLRFQNNIFIGPPAPEGGYAFNWYGPVNNAVFDANGYWPDGIFTLAMSQTATSLAGFQALGREVNGRILNGTILQSGLVGNRDYTPYMQPQQFTLASGSPAIDAALRIPGVNETFTGAAPDLGAVETGCAAPVYGPRPEGTDERNQNFGCASPTPPPSLPTSRATFVKTDTTTQGSWKGVYGAAGYNVVGDSAAAYPSYVSVKAVGHASYVWANPTSDVRAPQKGSVAERVAACWYKGSSFKIDLSFNDATPHQVAVYLLDFDRAGGGRTQKVEIVDANNNVLDTRTVTAFSAGQYLVWNLSGKVSIRVTNIRPSVNAVISGIFFR